MNKYFAVKTKCGHVGKNNYIEITFGIIAEGKKEASTIARWIPRVKHHRKDAIIEVNEINYFDYLDINNKNNDDNYLKVKSIQEQNLLCDIDSRIIREEKEEKICNRNVLFKLRKNKIIERELQRLIIEDNYYFDYVS